MDGIFSLKNTKYLSGAVRTIVDLLIKKSLWIYPTHSILSEHDILVLLCRDGPVATRSRFLQIAQSISLSANYMEMTPPTLSPARALFFSSKMAFAFVIRQCSGRIWEKASLKIHKMKKILEKSMNQKWKQWHTRDGRIGGWLREAWEARSSPSGRTDSSSDVGCSSARRFSTGQSDPPWRKTNSE